MTSEQGNSSWQEGSGSASEDNAHLSAGFDDQALADPTTLSGTVWYDESAAPIPQQPFGWESYQDKTSTNNTFPSTTSAGGGGAGAGLVGGGSNKGKAKATSKARRRDSTAPSTSSTGAYPPQGWTDAAYEQGGEPAYDYYADQQLVAGYGGTTYPSSFSSPGFSYASSSDAGSSSRIISSATAPSTFYPNDQANAGPSSADPAIAADADASSSTATTATTTKKPRDQMTEREQYLLGRERNRRAATKTRLKASNYVKNLMSEEETVTRENEELTAKVKELTGQREGLVCKLKMHTNCGCVLIRDYLSATAQLESAASASAPAATASGAMSVSTSTAGGGEDDYEEEEEEEE
ncbi:hypothetical protein B0H63DRAFT_544010 [Podospora didyma]|uniref:BZIP domain-containing protein n=1 Tax=Podospora didyma TaxID=330526 RepID=A0AAE0NQ15_9PEZI|nr:hypothetical protein B0H63DRAFT_544010 [Podospora didyma]